MSEQVGAIHFKANTDELDKAAQSLDRLAQAGPRVASALASVNQATANTGKSLKNIGGAEAGRGLDSVSNAAPKAADGLNKTTKSANDAKRALDGLKTSGGGIGDIAGGSKDAADGIQNLAAAGAKAKQSFDLLAAGVQAFVGLQIVGWAKDSAAALYQASAAAERLKIGLDFASARGSANEIEYLRRTTYDLGLQFSSTAQAYQQFQAAARGTSIEGDKARLVFESISKASAVMGLTADQSAGALLALQQMVSKGTVQAEELRGQLGERLPGAFQIAARSMGVTTAALGKMLENGEVLAEEFLPKFAEELTKSLGDAPEKAAERLDATINRTNDAWERLKQNVGDSGVSSFMAGQMNILADAMANFNNKVEAARDAGDGFGGQLLAAAGAALEFINPLNAISYSALEAGNQLSEAEKNLKDLKEAGAQTSSNLMLREAYAHAERLVNKLREAKQAQDVLAQGRSQAAVVGDPYNGGEQYEQYKANQREVEASTQAINALLDRRSGVTKQNIKDINDLNTALRLGVISEQQYRAEIIAINNEVGKRSGALKVSKERTTQQANAYQSLAEKATEYVRTLQIEAQQGSRLTQSQKLQIELDSLLAKGKGKINAASVAQIQSAIAIAKAMEEQAQSVKRAQAAYEDYLKLQEELADDYVRQSKAREALWLALDKSEQAIRDEAEMLALEESLIGKTNAVRDIAIAKLQIERDLREEIASIDRNLDLDEPARIEARSRARENAMKKIANAERKVYLSEWEKTSQMVGDTLADYIMGGGKDAATYLKRLFSTLVLQPVVQTVVGGILGTGAAAASGAGAGMMDRLANSGGSFTNWSNLGGNASQWLGQASDKLWQQGFQGLSDSALQLSNTIKGVDTWLKDIPGFDGGIGSALGYGSALLSLTQGNYGSGLGQAIGTYILPGIGTMIGGALGSLVDGMFGGGTPHGGAAAGYSGGHITDFGNGFTRKQINSDYTSGMQAGVSAVAATVGQSFDALAAVLGKQGGYRVTTGFSADSDDPAWGRLQIYDAVGSALVDWNAGRYGPKDTRLKSQFSSDPEKAFDQYLQSVAASSLPALKDIAPAWADAMIDSVTQAIGFDGNSWKSITVSGQEALTAMQSVVQQIAMVEAGFASLGNAMSMFSGISDEMKTALLGGLGGMEGLTATAQGFYQSYYSEQERYEASLKQMRDVMASIDLSIDPAMGEQAKQEYRATVEQAMAAGNGELAAQLLSLSSAFAQVADAAVQSAQRMVQSVSGAWSNLGTASSWAASYLGDGSGLQAQLGVVQASYAGATTVQGREAALEQIIALEQALWELDDRNRQAAAQAAQQQAEALQSQLASVNSLIAAAQNLGKYAEGLFTGADSGLGDQERLDVLAAQYSTQLSLAKAGDTDAMSSLQGTTSAYLQLAQQLSGSQSEYSVLSGRIAAELAATAAISGASAKTQADTLQAQISAAQAAAQYASQQFEVSAATKELIAKQLADSAKQFDSEMSLLQQQLQAGMNANYLLEGMPVELTGVLNTTLVPVIGNIADAAMSAASMSAASAEAARQAAAEAAAAAASAAAAMAAAIANARKGIDGSHAGGLSYVPFDGYTAELHKGERVLTAAENRMFSMPVIQVQAQQSSKELEKKVERLEAHMARMADATERLLDITDRVSADGNANATEIMNVRELAKAIAEEMA